MSIFKACSRSFSLIPTGFPLAALEKRSKLTPYEAGNYESGGRRFEKIVRFSIVDCVKAGWLLKQKGRWSVTDEGREALSKYKEAGDFYRAAVTLYRSWKKSQPLGEVEIAEPEDDTVAKAASVTLEEAEESAWGEVQQFVRTMNPYDFQDLVGALLRALGYFLVWTAPPGKDGGVDVVAAPDPLGTRSPRIKVQVKRQAASINVDGLRSFMRRLVRTTSASSSQWEASPRMRKKRRDCRRLARSH